MNDWMKGYSTVLERDMDRRRHANEAEMKRLRASESEDDKAVLAIAEILYVEECQFTEQVDPPPFDKRNPGFQTRIVALAFNLWFTYTRVGKYMDLIAKNK